MSAPHMWTVCNPLPLALAHFERELKQTMVDASLTFIREPGEGGSALLKALRAVGIVVRRVVGRSDCPTLVVWPLFGFFDVVTWLPASLRRPVVVIVHDVRPLRKQVGYGKVARWAFRLALRASPARRGRGLRIVVHSQIAHDHLAADTGVDALVIPHPLQQPSPTVTSPAIGALRRLAVLGQYKPARDTRVLASIADGHEGQYELAISGRGWPPIDGWTVKSVFLTEQEFDQELISSDAVIVPYRDFYQSGVAVRALERGVPIVAPRSSFIELLLGPDWPGIYDSEADATCAVERILMTGRAEIAALQLARFGEAVSAWGELVRTVK